MPSKLTSHGEFSTENVDEFREYIARLMDRRVEFLRHRNFRFAIQAAKLDRLTASTMQISGSFSTRSVDQCYVFTYLESGVLERRVNGKASFTIGPGEGSLLSPGREVMTTLQPGGESDMVLEMIVLPPSLLAAYARMMIGEDLVRDEPFEVTGPIGPNSYLAQTVKGIFDLSSRFEDFDNTYPVFARGFQQSLIAELIGGTNNNYRPLLDRARPYVGPFPRYVRRLEEYLEAHVRDPVGEGEMAQAAGVGIRTVEAACKFVRGQAPSKIWRVFRLKAVRRELLNPSSPKVTLTSVSRDHGFSNLNVFNQYYRKEFLNEDPHEALEKGRRKQGFPPFSPAG